MKKYSKRQFISELATQVTKSNAHNDGSHPSHRLAVCLAYALWHLGANDFNLTDSEIRSIASCFK